MHTTCGQCLWRRDEDSGCPGIGETDGCESLYVLRELDQSLLEEEPILLIPETSLQSLICVLFKGVLVFDKYVGECL